MLIKQQRHKKKHKRKVKKMLPIVFKKQLIKILQRLDILEKEILALKNKDAKKINKEKK